MNKIVKSLICIFLVVSTVSSYSQTQKKKSGSNIENEKIKIVIHEFVKNKVPPFSFIMDGRSSDLFIKEWNFNKKETSLDSNRTEYIFTYTNIQKTIQVTAICTTYVDYPAIEWLLYFKNISTINSPIFEDIKTIDTRLNYSNGKEFTLHLSHGSGANKNDFEPMDLPMTINKGYIFGPEEGRSSDFNALPFFNIDAGNEGVISAIGWTGRWRCHVSRDSVNNISFSAGFRKVKTYLLPGEEIRTPRVLLFCWKDADRMEGHNQFRRFILKHHTPQNNGKPVTLPFAFNPSGGGPSPCNENSCSTEGYAIAMINRYLQFGIHPEDFWIDAGWYEGSQNSWYEGVGNWTINKTNFPNGFKPISDVARKNNMGFVLWFEPERVFHDTRLDREHPEWIIKLKGKESGILNLGNDDARAWVTNYISSMIDNEGITVYREDFNIDPAAFWESADEPNREGMTEIKHIEGLYKFWDDLLARHPGLLIDNCASGGRRIDLETISRSVPLWRTDYQYFEPNGYQSQTYGLNFYLPCSGTGNINPDKYHFRSSMSSALIIGWSVSAGDFNLEQAHADVEEYKRLRPFFYADYYPITQYSYSDSAFMAYQFNRPESGDGVVFAFRRNKVAPGAITAKLKGLNADAVYEVNFEDDKIILDKSGDELMKNGIELKISSAPGSLVVSYKQKEK